MASEETVITTSATNRYQGNKPMVMCWANNPKSGGSSVVPT